MSGSHAARRAAQHWPFDARRHRSYVRSNRETTVPIAVGAPILESVRALRMALAGEDDAGIGRTSQRVVDTLCDAVSLPRIPVRVGGRRLVRGKIEYYGFCARNGWMTLYSRTARRNLVVAFKTYLNTLVHEYMHHYDWHALRIESMHTSGFYQRVGHLYRRILGELGEALG